MKAIKSKKRTTLFVLGGLVALSLIFYFFSPRLLIIKTNTNGALVYIDGEEIEMQGQTKSIFISKGEHDFGLKKKGFLPISYFFNITWPLKIIKEVLTEAEYDGSLDFSANEFENPSEDGGYVVYSGQKAVWLDFENEIIKFKELDKDTDPSSTPTDLKKEEGEALISTHLSPNGENLLIMSQKETDNIASILNLNSNQIIARKKGLALGKWKNNLNLLFLENDKIIETDSTLITKKTHLSSVPEDCDFETNEKFALIRCEEQIGWLDLQTGSKSDIKLDPGYNAMIISDKQALVVYPRFDQPSRLYKFTDKLQEIRTGEQIDDLRMIDDKFALIASFDEGKTELKFSTLSIDESIITKSKTIKNIDSMPDQYFAKTDKVYFNFGMDILRTSL